MESLNRLEEEGKRALKRQKLCEEAIVSQLDSLYEQVERTKRLFELKQAQFRRRKTQQQPKTRHNNNSKNKFVKGSGSTQGKAKAKCRNRASGSSGGSGGGGTVLTLPKSNQQEVEEQATSLMDCRMAANSSHPNQEEDQAEDHEEDDQAMEAEEDQAEDQGEEEDDESKETSQSEEDEEIEHMVQSFVKQVRLMNVEKNVNDELKSIHAAFSKYGKQIDKTLCGDITRICRSKRLDQRLVCRLIAEYLYQDGQLQAADKFCEEAHVDIPVAFRQCFHELHAMLRALRQKDMTPALHWARQHRNELRQFQLDIEFELLRLKYLDVLESCENVMEAVRFATDELSCFHETHSKDIGRLISCVLFKDRLQQSPYKDLFHTRRWEDMCHSIVRACCRLHQIPHRSYLQTCLSAGISALPAMCKLASVMENNVTNWDTLEELPVEIPLDDELRFHSVFTCPVSKDESSMENPPILLKCGHVICRACVHKISSNNISRRFKCPTCPMEQTESETRELFF